MCSYEGWMSPTSISIDAGFIFDLIALMFQLGCRINI